MEWVKRQLPIFGKMRGFWKSFYGLTEILEMMDEGRFAEAQAATCQQLKCLVQVGLDKGTWENGQLLLPWPDPLG
eukprot:1142838-Karenia_brevis.AAC.1